MAENTLFFKFLFLLLFISFNCSMYPWFTWNNLVIPFFTVITGASSAFFFFSQKMYNKKAPILFISLLTCFIYWESHYSTFMIMINTFFFVTLTTLIMFSDEQKKMLLNFITKYFSIFLVISLVAFLLDNWGISFISPTKIQMGERYLSFNHYLFINPQITGVDLITRFRSIYAEPGHLAMGATMLLAANHFNLKNKYVVVLLIVNIFSLSLAAYISTVLGLLLFNASVKKIKYVVGMSIVVIFFNAVLVHYGNDEILDYYIWRRLEYSESSGTIEGNDRTTAKYDQLYEETISKPSLFILGNNEYDKKDDYGGNAGYKKYIVEKGFFGVFLLICFYSFNAFKYRDKDVLFVTIITLLLLFQNAYPFWACVTIPYILSTTKEE